MLLSENTSTRRRIRWDALFAAYPAIMILREFPSTQWWINAVAWGTLGGGTYYAYLAACDRFGWQRGTRAVVIAALYLGAIFVVAGFQSSGGASHSGVGSLEARAKQLSLEFGSASERAKASIDRIYEALEQPLESVSDVRVILGALRDARTNLANVVLMQSRLVAFVLENSLQLKAGEFRFLVEIPKLYGKTHSRYIDALSEFLERSTIVWQYAELHWDAIVAAAEPHASTYAALEVEMQEARELHNRAVAAHHEFIRAAASENAEIARLLESESAAP